jgi:hypothetical protein
MLAFDVAPSAGRTAMWARSEQTVIERFWDLLEGTLRLFELLLCIAAVIGGGLLAWTILGVAEVDLLMRIGGTLVAGVAAFLIFWLVWTVLKFFN